MSTSQSPKLMNAGSLFSELNLYAATLEDPWTYRGIGIPDTVTMPSATFSITDKQAVATGANFLGMINWGVASTQALAGSLLPSNLAFISGCVNGSATMTNADLFNAATNTMFLAWNNGTAQVPASYGLVRLVSAAATYTWLGNAAATAGKLSVVFVPKNSFDIDRGANPVSLSTIEAYPGCAIIALNSLKPVTVKYRPIDNEVIKYVPTVNQTNLVTGSNFPGTFICVASGVGVAGAVLQGVFHGNYEAIPLRSSYNTSASVTSTADSTALFNGFNHAARIPPVVVGESNAVPQMALSSSGTRSAEFSSSEPRADEPDSSMMEKVFEVLPTWLDKGVGVATKLLPLLEAIA